MIFSFWIAVYDAKECGSVLEADHIDGNLGDEDEDEHEEDQDVGGAHSELQAVQKTLLMSLKERTNCEWCSRVGEDYSPIILMSLAIQRRVISSCSMASHCSWLSTPPTSMSNTSFVLRQKRREGREAGRNGT